MPHAQRRWGWGGIGAGQRNECDDSIAHQAIAHRAIAHTHLVDVDHDDLLHGRVLEHLPCRRSLPAAADEDLARIRMVQKGGVDVRTYGVGLAPGIDSDNDKLKAV